MAPGIDMSDKNAWDDSFLQDSWNDAVAEYEKYHSIAKSGKRLEDVLTEEELRELREDHGDLVGEAEPTHDDLVKANANSDQMDTEDSMHETEDVEYVDQASTAPQEAVASEAPRSAEKNAGMPQDNVFATMPQALLGTVQDENLKNLMMSWYYAGYYTGLHAGQQIPSNATPKQ